MNARHSGLTLLETLVALAVISIIISISLPNFSTFVAQTKADIIVGNLKTAVETGKASAIFNTRIVTLCRSTDNLNCSGKWHEGAILFTDGNGDREINQDDRLLYVFDFGIKQGTLSWNAFQNRQYLQFSPQGFTRYQNGNFTYCPGNKQSQLARQLIVNRTARARIAVDSNGDGFVENASGNAVDCD